MSWKHTLAQRVRRLTPDAARVFYDAHVARGAHIGDPVYRHLTGGYSSQAIDSVVTRKLAVRCGLLKVVT